MRRLLVAVAVLTAGAAGAQAGSLPEAVRLVDRMKVYGTSHFVRGSQGSGGGGSSSRSTAEARTAAPETPKPQKSPNPKPTPQPAKAD
jgi:hypothetical protein